MCGILGGIGINGPFDRQRCERALDLMIHRGPDAGRLEFREEGRVVLGHRRLKILDLSDRANQPMRTVCGRYEIVFNGEIYNFQALRDLVPDREWQTEGDTEVLLALYETLGEAMLGHLNGMFAFAIYDHVEKALFLARDRFGIKPLYFTRLPEGWMFASEIPPLLNLRGKAEPELETIKTYLATGVYEIGPHTFFQDIVRVEAGCCLSLNLKSDAAPEPRRWYDVSAGVQGREVADEDALIEELDELMARVVKRHLISDVPVGVNISGGVDSSALLHYVRHFHPSIHGFTQDYVDPYSEREWVEKASRRSGACSHFIMQDAADCLSRFEGVMATQGEPFGGVPVIGFSSLYECAGSLGVTVLLDGNGIDEIMLGYKKYHLAALSEARSRPDYEAVLADYLTFWQEPRSKVEAMLPNRNHEALTAIDGTAAVDSSLLGAALKETAIRRPVMPPPSGSYARDLALGDLLATKVPRALRFNDRISMMHSKELRVPFLDHELVEWSVALPERLLMNRSGTKAPLRRLLSREIDPSVAQAPKRTVQSPQREWLGNEWRPFVESILESDSFQGRGWICPDSARERYRRYLAGENENSFFIWQWINLEIWARQFLD